MKVVFSFALLVVVAIFFAGGALTAQAYSLSQTDSSVGGFSQLVSPFTNFFSSVQSISASDTNIDLKMPNNSSMVSDSISAGFANSIRGGFYQFDGWLAGIIGFHISTIVLPILNIFAWIIGFLDGIVKWLVNALHP